MKKNQNGFSVVEILVTLLVVSLISTVGWLVYDRQKVQNEDAPQTNAVANTNNDTKEADPVEQDAENLETKTITHKDASFAFAHPQDWTIQELEGYPGTDELNVWVTDPEKKLLFLMVVHDYIGDSPLTGGKAEVSFAGIGGKEYYIDSNEENSKSLKYSISSCKEKYCNTKLNDTYDLSLFIQPPVGGSNSELEVAITDPLIKEIEKIVSSIKIN